LKATLPAEGTEPDEGTVGFDPPGGHRAGNDWVLVLADVQAKYTTGWIKPIDI